MGQMRNTEAKTKVVQVRVTTAEFESLEKQARFENFTTMAAWVRKVLFDRLGKKRP